MKELLKNKLFIILLIFFIIILGITSNCFASDTIYLPEISSIVSDAKSYIITRSTSSGNTWLCTYSSSVTYVEITSSEYYYYVASGSTINSYKLSTDGLIWEFDSTETVSNTNLSFGSWEVLYVGNISNSDSIPNMTTSEVVFQAPPQQVEAVTIPAIQQVEEIPQGMTQVLQVIIPIGLIVLSIGLVIYLMRLVIYRMQS